MFCTGSDPALPELAGLAGARPWTNREGTDSRQVPGRLAIVGGGGVGVEMATAWHGLGSAVTMIGPGVEELLYSATVAVAGSGTPSRPSRP
jgi:pyruvate/2-oxoglutarate dehydrogenase complex dihydrolipoamide dehydrogenase (E3) component